MVKRNKTDSLQHFDDATRFINREISWLEFNTRVLEEAFNTKHPVLERLNFLSISASNLDEFYMVRVAGLKDLLVRDVAMPSQDGLTTSEQLVIIRERSIALMKEQQKCWSSLKKELYKERIEIVTQDKLGTADKKWLKDYFEDNIFPTLTPLAADPAHPFPFLPNLGEALILQLYRKASKETVQAVIPLPLKISRFVQLPQHKGKEQYTRFIMLEDVIEQFQEMLFPDCRVEEFGLVRITRDSELDIAEEAEDLVSVFETALKRRKRGHVIRLQVSSEIPKHLHDFVVEELQVSSDDVIVVDGLIGIANIKEILGPIDRPDLRFIPYTPRFPGRIEEFHGDCFAAIYEKDILVHHPYESFDVVVRFLQQAARDPDVVAIKQTLYRTSSDSPIVKALIEAAENGKSVTAVVELKARFDEEANIRWARDLERAGAQVVFGFVDLKTHSKLSLVVRKINGSLQSYVHFGTGNYHPVTATIYQDLSFFTCDADLTHDAGLVFNYLTGYSPPERLEKIGMSPFTVRSKLLECIDNEITFAKAKKPASIWMKCNAVLDKEIIDKLYVASQAGVKIHMVVRGICTLRPGVKGLSDNITVQSMVGRFLEHSRIYCFGNGQKMPSTSAKVFVASADLMSRNFDRRIEVMVPIENSTVHQQVLDQIMVANLKDDTQSWFMQADGSYKRVKPGANPFSAHEYFMTNPSLSGQGKASDEKRPGMPE